MKPSFFIQLHVHTDRSHDSKISVSEYISHLHSILSKNERAILGITDHNCLPLTATEALNLSTQKVFIIPGIQWKLHKSIKESLTKLVTRRELLTLGDHDDLPSFIEKKTRYEIAGNHEILGNFTENRFLEYISKKENLILVIPHPRYLFVDYYGPREIRNLYNLFSRLKIKIPFFVEQQTGYNPFPRVFSNYTDSYLTIASSDSHQLKSIFGTNSLFSVDMSVPGSFEIVQLWDKTVKEVNLNFYHRTIKSIFSLLIQKQDQMVIKKHYLRSLFHSMHSIPSFMIRRFRNFPRNFLK